MWRCVDLALTDVLEECVASIFRVEKSASGEPASAGGCRLSHQSEITSYIRTAREGDGDGDGDFIVAAVKTSQLTRFINLVHFRILKDYIL
jgi:hypothetical protein